MRELSCGILCIQIFNEYLSKIVNNFTKLTDTYIYIYIFSACKLYRKSSAYSPYPGIGRLKSRLITDSTCIHANGVSFNQLIDSLVGKTKA